MPFDFANLKAELRNDLWPSGERATHRPAHDKYFAAACSELQRFVDCLKANNVDIIDQCATYFNCGVTIFDYEPGAMVRDIRVVDRINPDTGKSDATHPIDWCTEIPYREVPFCDIEAFMGSNNGLSCISTNSLSRLFDIPTTHCAKSTFPKPTDADHNHKPGLPLGYHYGQSSTDSDCGRSKSGVWAKQRGRIYIAPWIESSESIIFDYDGVKRTWTDTDLVPDHPEYLKAVMFWVLYNHHKRLTRDLDAADAALSQHQVALQNLMYDCREGNRVRDCRDNDSHAREAVIPATESDSGDEEVPTLENQTDKRVDSIKPVTFDPPSGSKVILPTFVVLSTETEQADIYFTVDGSTPTADSYKYTGPIQIEPGDSIRAVAYKAGAYSSVSATQYSEYSSGSDWWRMHTTEDKVGIWDEFSANGKGDHAFVFKLNLASDIEIEMFTVLPLDSSGKWGKSDAWSTVRNVSPPELDGKSFTTSYPLLIIQTGSQVNYGYLDTLGTFSQGLRWILGYVEPFDESLNFFRLEVIIAGVKVHGIINGLVPGNSTSPPACPQFLTPDSETMKDEALTTVLTINGVSCSIFFAYRSDESKWVISDWACADDEDMELDSSVGFDADLDQIMQIKGRVMGSLFTVCYQTPDAYVES